MIRLELQGAPVRGNRLAIAQRGAQREAAVVVELRFVRDQRDGAIEEGQCLGRAIVLVEDDA
jgi:hypothetical protein